MKASSVKETLETTRQSILARQAKMASHVERRDEPLPADFSEQATEVINEETIEALASQLAEELQRVDAALAKLEKGEYGICEECGEDIEDGRIEALPATQFCVSCAS